MMRNPAFHKVAVLGPDLHVMAVCQPAVPVLDKLLPLAAAWIRCVH